MKYQRPFKLWLIAGLVLIFFQVFIGGITRLTGSGLSITKWDIVMGTFPPTSEKAWLQEFDLYKQTPQYKKINEGMELQKFKFIYFWEYLHRLWARMMGIIFIFPLIVFALKGWIDRNMWKRIAIVFFLAVLAASFGWIMVASGLINRPWVNAYKLTIHLSIALILYSYLQWTYLIACGDRVKIIEITPSLNRIIKIFLVVMGLQIVIGGVMSGMRAGILYPSWPDMNGELIPSLLLDFQHWRWEYLVNYDSSPFMPSLIQFVHRLLAYIVLVIGGMIFYKSVVDRLELAKTGGILFVLILVQVVLGIFTVLKATGEIPLWIGVSHQGIAMLVITVAVYLRFVTKLNRSTSV